MSPAATSPPALDRLRQTVAELDQSRTSGLAALDDGDCRLPLGVAEIDAALGGGLALGAVHDLAPAAPAQFGAATGFALVLAALNVARGGQVLWIQTEFAGLEAGLPYGPGLDLLGVPMSRLLSLRVARPRDALWAFEEALKCRAIAAVLAELPETGAAADLTATRRLSLAARGGGLGLLLRHRPSPSPSAAMSRWEIAAAPGTPDRFGGLGRTAFELSLIRNRRGRSGRWIVHWNHHERSFVPQALSLGLAAAAGHGSSDPQPFARAG
jgi:protein ImuA